MHPSRHSGALPRVQLPSPGLPWDPGTQGRPGNIASWWWVCGLALYFQRLKATLSCGRSRKEKGRGYLQNMPPSKPTADPEQSQDFPGDESALGLKHGSAVFQKVASERGTGTLARGLRLSCSADSELGADLLE